MPIKVEVICGPMGAGKTEELIRRATRELIAGKRVLAVYPKIDNRVEGSYIATGYADVTGGREFSRKMPAKAVSTKKEFLALVRAERPQVLAVDEAQLFPKWVISAIKEVMLYGIVDRIIIAGLNMDAWGEPFGPMPVLMAISQEVTVLTAVCTNCKRSDIGVLTQKTSVGTGQRVEVGSKQYTVRCRDCWTPPPKE